MKLILRHGSVTVTTAGTRVQLTPLDIVTPAVIIQAPATNTLRLYIGDKTVSSTNSFVSVATGGSCEISAASFGMADAGIKLSDIWVDVGTNGDKATFGWVERVSED
jgi:hypothetical protein